MILKPLPIPDRSLPEQSFHLRDDVRNEVVKRLNRVESQIRDVQLTLSDDHDAIIEMKAFRGVILRITTALSEQFDFDVFGGSGHFAAEEAEKLLTRLRASS